MKIKTTILIVLITICVYGQKKKKVHSEKDAFVSALIAKMMIDEKLGQLNLPVSGDITTGQAGSSDVAKKIAEGKVGGLFNIKTVQKIQEVQRIAVEKSRL